MEHPGPVDAEMFVHPPPNLWTRIYILVVTALRRLSAGPEYTPNPL